LGYEQVDDGGIVDDTATDPSGRVSQRLRGVAGRGHLRVHTTGCGAGTGQAPLTVSELGQLGVWCREPLLPRTEINEHGDALLDSDDTAQAVPVMRHSVLHGELLDRRSGGDLEGACGQVAPGHGAGSFHYHQYALTRPIRGAVCATRLIAVPGGRRHNAPAQKMQQVNRAYVRSEVAS